MEKKVFVLGLPGSGKTAASRYISKIASGCGYTVKSFNDYTILRQWFELMPEGPQFSRAENDGFDVHDYAILDDALQELEKQALREASYSNKEIITIEFARNEYFDALKQFSASFLQDAYFLYIDTEIPICKRRTRQRFVEASSSDDHYVSDYIFEAYYNKGREYCFASDINQCFDKNGKQYNVDSRKMFVVDNLEVTSLDAFYAEIERLTQDVIEKQYFVPPTIQPVYSEEQPAFVPVVNITK